MTHQEFLRQLPELVRNYRPSPDVLKKISNINLCMVIGPSGVGKSTLIERSGLHFVPSDTTRDSRPGEQNGVDMYFRKDYQKVMEQIKFGRFVQVAVGPAGDLYATKDSAYPDSGTGIMPIVADVIPIFRNLGFKKTISAFITPPTYEEWMRRLKTHQVPEDQLAKRLDEAQRSFKFALNDTQVHFILNDDIDFATTQLKNLVNGHVDKNREDMAKDAAKSIYAQLNTLAGIN